MMRSTDGPAHDVETPEDDSLPAVADERYGAFDVEDGSTVLFDREADGAWVRGDCAIQLRP